MNFETISKPTVRGFLGLLGIWTCKLLLILAILVILWSFMSMMTDWQYDPSWDRPR